MPTIKNREEPKEGFFEKLYKGIKGEKVTPRPSDVGSGLAQRAGSALEQRKKTLQDMLKDS